MRLSASPDSFVDAKRLLERRHRQARFPDPSKRLDKIDFQFNLRMHRDLVFVVTTVSKVSRREDALFQGPLGIGKNHLAKAIGHTVIKLGYRVLERESHILLEESADAALDGKRRACMEQSSTVSLPIIDDLDMRKLPLTASEEALEIIMRRRPRHL